MTTELRSPDMPELTGRDLDVAVASILGWTDTHPSYDTGSQVGAGIPPGESLGRPIPTYSAPDFSGFAPVVDWLTKNAPTKEQLAALLKGAWAGPFLAFHVESNGEWLASWETKFDDVDEDGRPVTLPGIAFYETAPTLPEAACRLLVSWAAIKRERGW